MSLDGRSRVLIVDADPGLRRSVHRRLLDTDVFADGVIDVKEALAKIVEQAYAVVLLDLNLPHAGAERILASIRAMPRETRPMVLVLAAASVARSLDVDVVQIVLRKPCDLGHLTAIVQSCVRSADSQGRPLPHLGDSDVQPLA